MRNRSPLSTSVIDIVDLVLNGELVEALTRYYHQGAWLPKLETIPTYTKGRRGQQALQVLKCNKCLYAKEVVNVGIGNETTSITWVYSGTVGSAIKSTYTVMSIQHWHEGKVLCEAFLHAN